MRTERSSVDRRGFLRQGIALGTGALVWQRPESLLAMPRRAASVPFIITSHTNDTGRDAMERAWPILADGGSAIDAVERGANVIELDPDGAGVG